VNGNRGSQTDVAELQERIPTLLSVDWCLTKDPSPPGTSRADLQPYLVASKADLPQAAREVWIDAKVAERVKSASDQLDLVANGANARIHACEFKVKDWLGVQVDGNNAVANVHGGMALCGVVNDSSQFSLTTDDGGCTGPPSNLWYHVRVSRVGGAWKLVDDASYCMPCG